MNVSKGISSGMQIKINKHALKKWIYLAFALFGFLIFARDVLGVPVNRFVFLLLATVILFFADTEQIFDFCLFLAPIHSGAPYNFIIMLSAVALVLKKKRFAMSAMVIPLIFIICFLEMLGMMRNYEHSISIMLQVFSILILFFVFLTDRKCGIRGQYALNSYVLGFIFAMFTLFGQLTQEYSLSAIFQLRVRLGDVNQSISGLSEGMRLSYNPNMLGGICAMAVVICILMARRQKIRIALVYYVLSLLAGIMCFMTLSRASLIGCAVGLIVVFLFSNGNIGSVIRKWGVIAAIVVMALFIIMNYLDSYVTFLFDRNQSGDVLNGRSVIFEEYFKIITSRLDVFLFGFGLQGYQYKSGMWNSAHNAIEEVWVAWGLIGLIAVTVLFCIIFLNIKKVNKRIRIYTLAPMAVMFIILMAGQGFSVRGNILQLMAAFGAMFLGDSKEARRN